jgi:hypothetical protein
VRLIEEARVQRRIHAAGSLAQHRRRAAEARDARQRLRRDADGAVEGTSQGAHRDAEARGETGDRDLAVRGADRRGGGASERVGRRGAECVEDDPDPAIVARAGELLVQIEAPVDVADVEHPVAQIVQRRAQDRGRAAVAQGHAEEVHPAARRDRDGAARLRREHRLRLRDTVLQHGVAEVEDQLIAPVRQDRLARTTVPASDPQPRDRRRFGKRELAVLHHSTIVYPRVFRSGIRSR